MAYVVCGLISGLPASDEELLTLYARLWSKLCRLRRTNAETSDFSTIEQRSFKSGLIPCCRRCAEHLRIGSVCWEGQLCQYSAPQVVVATID